MSSYETAQGTGGRAALLHERPAFQRFFRHKLLRLAARCEMQRDFELARGATQLREAAQKAFDQGDLKRARRCVDQMEKVASFPNG